MNPYPPTDSNGYIKAVYYGQNERVDELNARLNDRTFPDAGMQPNFSPRPVQTKYTTFPMLNARIPPVEPIRQLPEFTTENFYTGTSNAPNCVNIDKESELRNQFFALQKSDQSVYVPDANSDLYKVNVVYRPSDQQYPDLFAKPQFNNTPHPNLSSSIGGDLFNNNTRTQLRNL